MKAGTGAGIACAIGVAWGMVIALYLGRLVILEPTSPVILVPALLNGFLVNPALYIWLGLAFLRGGGS